MDWQNILKNILVKDKSAFMTKKLKISLLGDKNWVWKKEEFYDDNKIVNLPLWQNSSKNLKLIKEKMRI